jgi:hypothetical protein
MALQVQVGMVVDDLVAATAFSLYDTCPGLPTSR